MTVSFKNIEAIVKIVKEVMINGSFADKAFEAHFKTNRTLTAADTAFIVEEVYHLIRNWRLFSEIQTKANIGQSQEVAIILGIGLTLAGHSLPDWKMFKSLNADQIRQVYNKIRDNRAINLSMPNWLDEAGYKELGDRWLPMAQSLNQESKQVIRINALKCSKDKLQQAFISKGIKSQFHNNAPDALILNQKLNVFKLPEFKQGLFEMQDVSSQMVGNFANPQPGMRVIDGCAGNGGKTLHLASLMQNKGRIIALDLFAGKLDTLKCRASRAGISIIETRVIYTTKVIKRLYGTADMVLLDVPCSGLGVLKRNPEIKWRLQPTDLENLNKTQEDILNRYSLMVKPGGKLIYSTCSILPSENSIQIQKFLEKHHDNFDLLEDKLVSPEEGFDGFYMALLSRKA